MSIDTGLSLTYRANYPEPNVDQSSEQFRVNFSVIKTAIERLQTASNSANSILALTSAVGSDATVKLTIGYRNNALILPSGNPTNGVATSGMIRYNPSTSLPEFHNGTGWTTIGTGTGGSGDYLPLSGGTVTGNTTFDGDVTVTGTIAGAFFDGFVAAAPGDLAERYAVDNAYEAGTVMIWGGSAEITTSTMVNDTRLAGVISTDPAFGINAEAGTDLSHPYLALIGRVPCKVIGMITKGDMLTTSATPGHAQRATTPVLGAILGKALEHHNSTGTGVIEISVQRC